MSLRAPAWLGGLLVMSACGAGRPQTSAGPTSAPGATDPRTELSGLDAKLAAERDELGLPAPPESPAGTVQPMSTDAHVANAANVGVAPTCPRAPSETCTNVCALADAICNDANRICVLATQLPGDADAATSCSRGHATCDGATARCCGCQ